LANVIFLGENHIVMLTEEGQLYTVGCAEQGRLGRIAELFVGHGGRRGLALLLSADQVHTKNKRVAFAGDKFFLVSAVHPLFLASVWQVL
jgi:alpha-tubulin suppressor-like RCC1 family protein